VSDEDGTQVQTAIRMIEVRQKIVGIYQIGDDSVQVVLREGNGGDFYLQPRDIETSRIKVGADVDNWHSVVAALMHEAAESVLARLCLRMTPDDEFGRDLASYIFVMRHEQFSDVCARTGRFLAQCLPDVSKAWKEWKKHS
jgi:hypothetical protein